MLLNMPRISNSRQPQVTNNSETLAGFVVLLTLISVFGAALCTWASAALLDQ